MTKVQLNILCVMERENSYWYTSNSLESHNKEIIGNYKLTIMGKYRVMECRIKANALGWSTNWGH